MEDLSIRRLGPSDANPIIDCFERVYADSYANENFHDATRLSDQMRRGKLFSVGAVREDGRVMGHMAMFRHAGATSAELGNSVVDPDARGQGLIWKIGAELVAWSMEFGDHGFLDYPTTAHHIMQRQSIETGCETGLMLGYVPAGTDGKVSPERSRLRAASTIVYHPYANGPSPRSQQFLPAYCSDLVRGLAESGGVGGVGGLGGVERDWRHPRPPPEDSRSVLHATRFDRRDLARLTIDETGADVADRVAGFEDRPAACRQIDFVMSDAGIGAGVSAALDAGYWFCGWLPGFAKADVFRMQKVDRSLTDMSPSVVNPVARSLLDLIDGEVRVEGAVS